MVHCVRAPGPYAEAGLAAERPRAGAIGQLNAGIGVIILGNAGSLTERCRGLAGLAENFEVEPFQW